MSKNLEEKFRSFCNSQNLEINQNQIKTIKLLQDFNNKNFHFSVLNFFKKENYKKGFYLHGGVGVGKTMILDFFYDLFSKKKLRLHFNEFMLSFHNFVHQNKSQGDENIINIFVKDLKSKALLIYFDEFQVTNIVDAMILGKLFDKIFSENIKIIITSNIQISDLYKDGLQRDQFKPFIDIMKKKTVEHELVIKDDYRKSNENQNDRYFFPLNQESNFKMNKFFRIISKDRKKTTRSLDIKGREFLIEEFYEGVVRFTFDELCDKNLGAEDYLEIAKVSKFECWRL
jgi:cell division protein ZapE